MRIRAFQGLRPRPDLAAQVASLPYDVVNTAEAKALADGNPLSFLHVVRAEIDLPDGTDLYSAPVYAKARENLESLQADGRLVREPAPCMYIYEQEMGGHVQRGLVSVCHIEDYENDLIKKHEKTRQAKEDDRTTAQQDPQRPPRPGLPHLPGRPRRSTGSSRPPPPATRSSTSPHPTASATPPGASRTAARIRRGLRRIPAFYVADGHHRSASAARVGAERRAANPNHTGEEDYNWFLAVLFPASQLKILPYNRLVHDLNEHSPESFLAAIARSRRTSPKTPNPSPQRIGDVCIYLGGKLVRGLTFRHAPDADPIARLDVASSRTASSTPSSASTTRAPATASSSSAASAAPRNSSRRVDQGDGRRRLLDVPRHGRPTHGHRRRRPIMPPKSTWFEPKLRSGLFVHTF